MTLSVIPDSLQFAPKLSEDNSIQLTNVSFKPILFRVRTTAPHRYVVKPSKGVVQSNKTEIVNIHLSDNAGETTEEIADEFCIVYCELADGEVVAPKGANVPDLIKSRPKSDLSKRVIKSFIAVSAKQPNNNAKETPESVRQNDADAATKPAEPSQVKPKVASPTVASKQITATTAEKSPAAGSGVLPSLLPAIAVLLVSLFVSYYFFNLFE